MKKQNRILVIALLSVMTLNILGTTVAAQDFVLLELLIQNHKIRSNKLNKRGNLKAEGYGLTLIEKNKTQNYEDVVDQLSNRMGGLMSYVAFAADVYALEQLAEEVVRLEKKAIKLTGEASSTDQGLADTGMKIQNEFTDMISRITTRCIYVVTSGLGVSMATQEQRKQFTDQTGEDLRKMRNILRNFVHFGEMKMIANPARNGNDAHSREMLMQAIENYRKEAFQKTLKLIDKNVDIFKK